MNDIDPVRHAGNVLRVTLLPALLARLAHPPETLSDVDLAGLLAWADLLVERRDAEALAPEMLADMLTTLWAGAIVGVSTPSAGLDPRYVDVHLRPADAQLVGRAVAVAAALDTQRETSVVGDLSRRQWRVVDAAARALGALAPTRGSA